jgi:hypothetical protein
MVAKLVPLAFKLASWCLEKDPTSPKDQSAFFSFLQKRIILGFQKQRPNGKSTFEILRVAARKGIPFQNCSSISKMAM